MYSGGGAAGHKKGGKEVEMDQVSSQHFEYVHKKIFRTQRLLEQAFRRHRAGDQPQELDFTEAAGWVSLALRSATEAATYSAYVLERSHDHGQTEPDEPEDFEEGTSS